ncbi:MAG: hypothetical protein CMJ80_10035 [Planctomycetaceae bacterium]|nr:hypothetical protein [Planctomycetaceae bacterium]
MFLPTCVRRSTTELPTCQSDQIANRVSSRIITVSGIVTIAAVILVFFLLLAAVLPLFRSVTVRRTTTVPCSGETPVVFGVDEYREMAWALLPSGWFIARVIASQPEVLLLAEAWSLFDPIATGKIEESLSELLNDYWTLIVARSLQQASRISDYAALPCLRRRRGYGPTIDRFTRTKLPQTEDYVTGRLG